MITERLELIPAVRSNQSRQGHDKSKTSRPYLQMTRPDPIEDWVRMVETLAYECGATVVMGGVVITGIMTPFERYGRWAREVHMRAGLAGGKFPIPPGEMLPLSPEEVGRIRREWAAIEDEERRSRGIGEDEEFDLDLDLGYFCLRNAEVRAGQPATWLQFPYLLLRTAAVDAFFPSIVGQ